MTKNITQMGCEAHYMNGGSLVNAGAPSFLIYKGIHEREQITMKISFKELRKTPFELKASVKNLKKTYAIQLKLAGIEDSMSEDTPVASMNAVLDALEGCVAKFF